MYELWLKIHYSESNDYNKEKKSPTLSNLILISTIIFAITSNH